MDQSVRGLLELHQKFFNKFNDQKDEREAYKKEHPTEIIVMECMDGRCCLPVVTGSLVGVLRQYRNIGGKFDIGWPYLRLNFRQAVESAEREGHEVLVLTTYHWSVGEKHRGCAGFNYKLHEAVEYVTRTRDTIAKRYDVRVSPILVGIETDTDALVLHGESGEQVNLASFPSEGEYEVMNMLTRLYPSLTPQVRRDLYPLVQGNLRHIAEVKGRKQPKELEHNEWVLAVGRGFDWLYKPNTALIVGPCDPDVRVPIATAAKIIKSNLEDERIKNHAFVVLSSEFIDGKFDREPAIEQANYMGRMTRDVVQDKFPEILDRMHRIHVVIDRKTMKLEVVFEKSGGSRRRAAQLSSGVHEVRVNK